MLYFKVKSCPGSELNKYRRQNNRAKRGNDWFINDKFIQRRKREFLFAALRGKKPRQSRTTKSKYHEMAFSTIGGFFFAFN